MGQNKNMGIGNSNITKKQWKQYAAEFAKLSTKEDRNIWLANGEVDAVLLTNIKTDDEFWVPIINHVRFCDGDGSLRFDTREDALSKAIELKKEFQNKVLTTPHNEATA